MATTYTVIAVAQGVSTGAAAVATSAFAADPVTGDVLLAAVSTWKSGQGVTHAAPTDTAGNAYLQVGPTLNHPAGNLQVSLWRCVNATGGSAFVVTDHVSPATYNSVIAWAVRPSTAVLANSDTASQASAFDNGANDPTTSPAPPGADAFFLSVAVAAVVDNVLAAGTGWNTAANGFTGGMATAATYGLNSVGAALYTAYTIAATAQQGLWDDTNSAFNARSVIVASVGPAGTPTAITGDGTVTLGALALSGAGSIVLAGAGDVTFAPPGLTSSGDGPTVTGTGTLTIGVPGFVGGPVAALVTQTPVEVAASTDTVTFSVTQTAVEVAEQSNPPTIAVVITQTAVEAIYAFSGVCGTPALGPGGTFPQRRLRQWALPSDPDGRWIFLRRLELVLQAGVGLTTGQGSDPHVLVQLSRDGGQTWGPERRLTAGQRGQYEARAWLQNAGRYRDGAVRIVVSDPVVWQFLAADAVLEVGTS